MPVPDYETLTLPVLRAFAAGAENVAQVLPILKADLRLGEEDAAALLPSGRKTVLADREHWARTYLSKTGLLESPRRNLHRVTQAGRDLLARNPARIDNRTLAAFDGFEDWRTSARGAQDAAGPATPAAIPPDAGQTPDERIGRAHAEIEAALRDDRLERMTWMPPPRFEALIPELLGAMGYDGGAKGAMTLTPASGDGGIDGIMHEDALGLDAVHIQAKRYAEGSRVGSPALQQFIGSLNGEGATKGVFVTTSDFSREAREYLRARAAAGGADQRARSGRVDDPARGRCARTGAVRPVHRGRGLVHRGLRRFSGSPCLRLGLGQARKREGPG